MAKRKIYGPDNERDWKRLCEAVRKVERAEPRPKRGARVRRSGGDGSASLIGAVAVASADIGEPTEMTWANIPEQVKDKIDNAEEIDNAEPCWQLNVADGKLYQLVSAFDDSDPPQLTAVYMVPVARDFEVRLYNSAGPVAEGVPLQIKKVRMGGDLIALVDVEKCD